VSPRHLDSWEYLGALLFAFGRTEEALVTYNQLYQLDSSNLETMAHIAECYYHLGFPGLARSYANHLEILNAKVRIPVVNRIIQMIVS
jgi:tetratricopeptide (TPR) repeat protein